MPLARSCQSTSVAMAEISIASIICDIFTIDNVLYHHRRCRYIEYGDDAMAQHFLLSRAAKTLTLAMVLRMTDTDAELMLRNLRWAETNGDPVCPSCGGAHAYDC